MTRTSLETHHCSVARTVDIIGDRWALMILRDAFYGVRAFSALQASLGVAKTVLSDRLRRLTQAGILEKVRAREGVERFEYRLTASGRELFPVVVALMQWGDRWVFGAGHEPAQILDRETGSPVQPLAVQARSGKVLTARDVMLGRGPGVTTDMR